MKSTLLFAIIATMLFSCKKDTLPLYSAWKGPPDLLQIIQPPIIIDM
jgi:hypothetical protein